MEELCRASGSIRMLLAVLQVETFQQVYVIHFIFKFPDYFGVHSSRFDQDMGTQAGPRSVEIKQLDFLTPRALAYFCSSLAGIVTEFAIICSCTPKYGPFYIRRTQTCHKRLQGLTGKTRKNQNNYSKQPKKKPKSYSLRP